MIAKGSELYAKLLRIYKTQYDNLTKAQKKRIKVQNMPENLPFDLYLDEDEDYLPPLEGDEEVISEPKETIAKRKKIKSSKKNKKKTGT